jgi:hypothetical protein
VCENVPASTTRGIQQQRLKNDCVHSTDLRFRLPTQLFTQTQWWSMSSTHALHSLQCFDRATCVTRRQKTRSGASVSTRHIIMAHLLNYTGAAHGVVRQRAGCKAFARLHALAFCARRVSAKPGTGRGGLEETIPAGGGASAAGTELEE